MTYAFIEYLEGIHARGDRAALAALRRGASRSGEAAAYPIVAPFFPSTPDPHFERSLVEVATLFSLHPGSGGVSIARALRRVQDRTGSESIEQRLVGLLDCHRDELATHLRHAISLARGHDVILDWHDLFEAMLGWDRPGRHVQRRWAREFWASTLNTEASS